MIVHSKLMIRVTALAFSISAITGMSGCGSDDPHITALQLNAYSEDDGEYSDRIYKPIGIAQEITAIGTFSDGSNKEITNDVNWDVDDSINVSEGGFFVGTEVGHYDVNASYGDSIIESNTIRLNISDAVLQSLDTELGADQILKGDTSANKALGHFSDQTKHDITNYVTWIASDPEVAMATNSGVLGRSKGTTHISSSFDGVVSDPQKLDVVELDDIIISNRNPESINGNKIIEGTSTVLSAFGVYSNGYTVDLTKVVTWESADLNTVTTHNLGLVKAISPGITNITASHDNVSADEVEVEVVPAMPVSIDVSSSDTGTLYVGNTRAFTGSVTYDNGMVTNGSEIQWSSEDSSLEPIANTGVFVAAEPNSNAKVIASVEGQYAFFDVNVVEAAINKVEIRTANGGNVITSTLDIYKGEEMQLTAWGKYQNSDEYQNITNLGEWISDNEHTEVLGSGHLFGASRGTTVINFNLPNLQQVAYTRVLEAPVISVSVERAEKTDLNDLFPSEALKLKLVMTRKDGSTFELSNSSDLRWTVDNNSLAEISDDGIITVKANKTGALTVIGTWQTSDGSYSSKMVIPVVGIPVCGGAYNAFLPSAAMDHCLPAIAKPGFGRLTGYPTPATLLRMGYSHDQSGLKKSFHDVQHGFARMSNEGQSFHYCEDINNWNVGGNTYTWSLTDADTLHDLFVEAKDGLTMYQAYNWFDGQRVASSTYVDGAQKYVGLLTNSSSYVGKNEYPREEAALIGCYAN